MQSDDNAHMRDEREPNEDAQDVHHLNELVLMPLQARPEDNQHLDDQQNIFQLNNDDQGEDQQAEDLLEEV